MNNICQYALLKTYGIPHDNIKKAILSFDVDLLKAQYFDFYFRLLITDYPTCYEFTTNEGESFFVEKRSIDLVDELTCAFVLSCTLIANNRQFSMSIHDDAIRRVLVEYAAYLRSDQYVEDMLDD